MTKQEFINFLNKDFADWAVDRGDRSLEFWVWKVGEWAEESKHRLKGTG